MASSKIYFQWIISKNLLEIRDELGKAVACVTPPPVTDKQYECFILKLGSTTAEEPTIRL